MGENNYCEICGEPGEKHHIVLRRKSSAMINAKINHKYLCGKHHRGNDGPHLNRKIDIKYKLELQKKLFHLFGRENYHRSEIVEILEIKPKEVDVLVKTLTWHSEGYISLDIVTKCMGGRLYSMLNDSEKLRLINAMEFIEDDADGENCTSVTVKDTKINRDILDRIGFDRSYLEYEGLIDEYGDINVAPIAFKYCNWWAEYYFTNR